MEDDVPFNLVIFGEPWGVFRIHNPIPMVAKAPFGRFWDFLQG